MKKIILLALLAVSITAFSQASSYKVMFKNYSQYENGTWIDYGTSIYYEKPVNLYINYESGFIWLTEHKTEYQLLRKIKGPYYQTTDGGAVETCFDYTGTTANGKDCKIILEYTKEFITIFISSNEEVLSVVASIE